MSRGEASDGTSAASWAASRERGSHLALRFMAWCFRHLGDGVARVLLVPIAVYYSLFAGSARQASRDYLMRIERVRGRTPRRPGMRQTYRHFHSFASVLLDRFSFWTGRYDKFDIVIHGRDEWEEQVLGGKGLFMIGAHLGSFDALRVIARDAEIPVNVLMFSVNAPRINATLEALDPGSKLRIIDLDPTSVRAAFEIRQCVARGEIVAILADRLSQGGRRRSTRAQFLGDPALFPLGPFLLPMVLGLPTILVLALKTGPRSYEVFLEELADAKPVPRKLRDARLQERVDHFAARLEHYCLKEPFQWFNFYDFWAESQHGRS